MNIVAYEFIIWRPILHNRKFSHNTVRREVLQAQPNGELPDIVLEGKEESVIHASLTIVAEPEYIKSVRKGQLVMREEFVADPQVPPDEEEECSSIG